LYNFYISSEFLKNMPNWIPVLSRKIPIDRRGTPTKATGPKAPKADPSATFAIVNNPNLVNVATAAYPAIPPVTPYKIA